MQRFGFGKFCLVSVGMLTLVTLAFDLLRVMYRFLFRTTVPPNGYRLQEIVRKYSIRRSEVLFQTMKLGRAWDRHNPRLLSEQPCQGNLPRPLTFLSHLVRLMNIQLAFLNRWIPSKVSTYAH